MPRNKLADVAIQRTPRARSYVRVSGPKARKIMQGMKVGGKHVMKVAGKVRSLNSSDYDDSVELDLEDCEHCEGEQPKSLTRAMKRRRNRGRFA